MRPDYSIITEVKIKCLPKIRTKYATVANGASRQPSTPAMHDFERTSAESTSVLLASKVGEYVLHNGRVGSPPYFEQETVEISKEGQGEFCLGGIAAATQVVIWRRRSTRDIRLEESQLVRLGQISRGINKEARARAHSTSLRTEARRTAELLDRLETPMQASAVILGICTGLIETKQLSTPNQPRLTKEELKLCRSLGLGETLVTVALSLNTVSQKLSPRLSELYDKVLTCEDSDATRGHPSLMRRLFEIGIFQIYTPGKIPINQE